MNLKTLQTETGIPAQNLPARPEYRCPLAPSKGCQQAQWCHDKSRLVKAHIRSREEIRAARQPLDSDQSMQVRVDGVIRAQARSSLYRELAGSPQHTSLSHHRLPLSSAPMRGIPERPVRRPGRSRLRWLETLQALSQLRCWLLRICLVPWFRSKTNTHTTTEKRA